MSESACVRTSSTCATETKVGSPLGGGQDHTSGKVQTCANVSNLLIGVTPPLCDVTESSHCGAGGGGGCIVSIM